MFIKDTQDDKLEQILALGYGPIDPRLVIAGGVDDDGGDEGGDEGGDDYGDDEGGEDDVGESTGSAIDMKAIRESIKDEKLRAQAERFNSVEDILRGNLESRQKLSRAIVKPGKDADEVEIASFRKALGVPETIEGYEFPASEDDPPEARQAREDWGKLFHEHNVPKEAFDAILTKYVEAHAQMAEQIEESDRQFAEKATEELKQEWGRDYEQNILFARKGAEHGFGDEFEDAQQLETAEGQFLLDHPMMLRYFSRIGREMSEGGLGETLTAGQKE